MAGFVFGIIIGAIALILLLAAFPAGKMIGGPSGAGTGAVMAVVALILGGFSFLTFLINGEYSVPTRSVGILTSYGKVMPGYLLPGRHFWIAPWDTLHIVSEGVQTTTFEGTDCLTVRIGGQQSACLNVSVQWRVLDNAAGGLFANYGSRGDLMNDIENNVVIRNLGVAANDILGNYNPIQDISRNPDGSSEMTGLNEKVKVALAHAMGRRIDTISVFAPSLQYDSSTQDRLNQIQQQRAKTAVAREELATNQAQNRALEAIKHSVTANPLVLQYQCLQLLQAAQQSGFGGLPAALTCGLGNSSTTVAVGGGR